MSLSLVSHGPLVPSLEPFPFAGPSVFRGRLGRPTGRRRTRLLRSQPLVQSPGCPSFDPTRYPVSVPSGDGRLTSLLGPRVVWSSHLTSLRVPPRPTFSTPV